MAVVLLGYVAAILSAVGNGTFAALSRLLPDQHPFIFNFMLGLGVVLSSLLASAIFQITDENGNYFQFNILAMLGGALLAGATTFSFLAIPRLGLAAAQGIWGGTAILVAFSWGLFGPSPIGKPPQSAFGSFIGVAIIVSGVLMIVFLPQVATKLSRLFPSSDPPLQTPLGEDRNEVASQNASTSTLLGVGFAVTVGFCGGSVLVPATLSKLQTYEILMSFGIGTVVATSIPAMTKTKEFPKKFAEIWPGVLAGCIWNLGNMFGVYANTTISYAIAQPLFQCALVPAGILGIFAFKEISGTSRIGTFFIATAIVLLGASTLAVFGPKAS
eukprot:TRINITY_DN55590_c0_g1_i1.p1 TRINITY_DN55590_c0_g1~~TRINITY_DN55590_c0_g1_i1.p1  ORF type:complete len:382 (+),score=28.69 TRINITY_DN55590_c0_g1_i1:162-1148(+)